MNLSRIFSVIVAPFWVLSMCCIHPSNAAIISGQGTWETTLQARDLDGDPSTIEAYYDTELDITWLANANYFGSTMTWADANAWAAGLDLDSTAGPDGWRLPNANPIDGTTADDDLIAYNGTEDQGHNISAPGTLYAGSTANEMAHLFFNTLGNLDYCTTSSVYPDCTTQAGYGLSNSGPFSNIQAANDFDLYWTGTEYAPNSTSDAWVFSFYYGYQAPNDKASGLYAWAVHDGDFGTAIVPLPASVWLFGGGLLGLIGIARRTNKLPNIQI